MSDGVQDREYRDGLRERGGQRELFWEAHGATEDWRGADW